MLFLTTSAAWPEPADPERARTGLEHWRERAAADPELAAFARTLESEPHGRRLLASVFGNSPYLSQLLLAEMGFARTLIKEGPDAAVAGLLESAATGLSREADRTALMRGLRTAKRRAALAVALADIGGLWPLEKVTAALSDLAQLALTLCVRHLMAAAAESGEIGAQGDPVSGYFVLGMGKLGSRELNYSSDVDLIVLFDPDRMQYTGTRSLPQLMVQTTRELVRMMEERGPEGYVFRCDLRLRPDPGATPLAVSVVAAETYYEAMGQNWERAAMIKARCVAGDTAAGDSFLKILVPYVWRKHLDFAAIDDIHSIKRQIHAYHGGETIRIAGHNVKLGRGGIREIEFFAQTQQLIWGGRVPRLRKRGTLEAIAELAAEGRMTEEAAREMTGAYVFLRRVEHRLQMIEDQQVHTLPEDDAGLRAVAVFLGFPGTDAFAKVLIGHLRNVERHYAALFEEAPTLSGPGNLVFTGTEHDPETLKTLERLGFSDPPAVSAAVMAWHRGRYAATRSPRAREILTELVPAILAALGRTASPQAAFLRFDEFLGRLPAGVQLFSLFQANPALLDLVAEIMGDAPHLADLLARRPILLDGVLSADFFEPLPTLGELEDEFREVLGRAGAYEAALDVARRWAGDKKFRVGVHILRNLTTADAAGPVLSDIAQAVVRGLKPLVEAAFANAHGRVPGGDMAVIAMGRLGGREMTVGSDLDLVFVYDFDEAAEQSDGEKPLSPHEYFGRLSRRLINALSAQTAEGQLFAVDMRLRPSGTSGPIASHLEAFRRYHEESAWTWEHLALARARVVAGTPDLAAAIEEIVRAALTREREPGALARDVLDMRLKMAAEHKPGSLFDVKHLRGGLIDAEFIVQFLELRHAHAHPGVLRQNTAESLHAIAEEGILPRATAGELARALKLWQRILGLLRLCYPEPIAPEEAPPGLRRILVAATGAADFDILIEEIEARSARVRAIFDELIAGAAAPAEKTKEKP